MTNPIESVLLYTGQALFVTVIQLLVLIAPSLGVAFVMHILADRVIRLAVQAFGPRLVLGLFGWLGVAVHEIGHIVFALIFRHEIVDVQLFNSDPRAPAAGAVLTSYNRNSVYQRIGKFFIGIGSILFGTIMIYIAARLLLDPAVFTAMDAAIPNTNGFDLQVFVTALGQGAWVFLSSLFRLAYLLDWKWYLFLYIAFSVGSFVGLSAPDIEASLSGLVTLCGSLLLWNLATLWAGNFVEATFGVVSQIYMFFYAIISIAIVMNLIALGLLLGIRAFVRNG